MKDKLDIIMVGGNGRMGRTIIGLLEEEKDFHLAGVVDRKESLAQLSHLACPVSEDLESVLAAAPGAVIIDFTAPGPSLENARLAAEKGRRMVIGTTGLDENQKKQLAEYARITPILWSANMSIGINVLMRFLPDLARALGDNYDLEMVEVHHKHKKDAPSGTALMLGEALARARGVSLPSVRCSARNGIIGERPAGGIGIQALRGGDVVGIHTCYFLGPGEMIEVSHQAESRENFAQGALRAARWLSGQNAGRLYSMQDVIQLPDQGGNAGQTCDA